MRAEEALSLGQKRLLSAGIDEAQTECEYMLMKLLNVTRSVLHYDLYLLASEPSAQTAKRNLTTQQEQQFFEWVESREKRIPLAYLFGDAFFHSLKLKVRQGCLIPRPETERLLEETIKVIREDKLKSPSILDVGTGSGAIALALLSVFKEARATLIDFSTDALKIARENAADHGFLNRAEFIHSDLYINIPRGMKWDVIVSNPPYLTEADLSDLQPEVAHEPRMALDGGKDGLNFYRRLIPESGGFLKPEGRLGFEVGAGQAPAVCEILKKNGYKDVRVFRDHQEIERVVTAKKKG